jgi:deoxyribonuclease-4
MPAVARPDGKSGATVDERGGPNVARELGNLKADAFGADEPMANCRLKLGSHMSIAGGPHMALRRAAEQHMEACQLFTKNERQWNAKPLTEEQIMLFRSELENGPIKARHVVAHDSYLINVASPDDEMWEKSRRALADELNRCEQLGIPYLVSHPGAHVQSGVEAGIARVIEAVNRINDEAPERRSVLLLETTAGQGTTLGARFEELAQMIDGIEDKSRVAVCFDTCHVFAAG